MTTILQVLPEYTRTQDTYCLAFNYDATVFAVGTVRGFSLYSADPFVLLAERPMDRGVKLVAMYQQANVLCLVPGERSNRILLWDDSRCAPTGGASCGGEHEQRDTNDAFTSVVARVDLDGVVAAVKLHRYCIVASSQTSVYLFDNALNRVACFESDPVAAGALAIAALDRFDVPICAPGPTTGSLLVITYYDVTGLKAAGPQTALPPAIRLGGSFVQLLAAPHNSSLATVAITADGAAAVTASVHGTALKLVDTKTGAVLRQLNRGRLASTIHSVCFNPAGTLAAAVSESGTVHVFNVSRVPFDKVRAPNAKSVLTRLAQHALQPPSAAAAAASGGWQADTTAGGTRGAFDNYASFAAGEYAFATFALGSIDETEAKRLFHGTVAGLRSGVDSDSRATLLVAQADWGRLFKVLVDVTERGEAALRFADAAESTSAAPAGTAQSGRCALVSTSRFPEVPLL